MRTATINEAREIVIMNAFRCPTEQVGQYLADYGIEGVYGYHVTPAANAESIRAKGIQPRSCYSRNDAVYLFLDPDETDHNAPILVDGEYAVVRVLIPADVAATIKDDDFYKANFYRSGSAAYIERAIPAEWITS